MRIIQFSDTHLSHLGGTPSKNMSSLVDYLNKELVPDLVINTGDVVIVNPDSAEDRRTAHELHEQIAAPLRVLPGNHDVGESGDNPWMDLSVTVGGSPGSLERGDPTAFSSSAAPPPAQRTGPSLASTARGFRRAFLMKTSRGVALERGRRGSGEIAYPLPA